MYKPYVGCRVIRSCVIFFMSVGQSVSQSHQSVSQMPGEASRKYKENTPSIYNFIFEMVTQTSVSRTCPSLSFSLHVSLSISQSMKNDSHMNFTSKKIFPSMYYLILEMVTLYSNTSSLAPAPLFTTLEEEKIYN